MTGTTRSTWSATSLGRGVERGQILRLKGIQVDVFDFLASEKSSCEYLLFTIF